MFTWLSIIFKLNWLSSVVINILSGIYLARQLFAFIKTVIESTHTLENFIPAIDKMILFLDAVINVVTVLAKILRLDSLLPSVFAGTRDVVYTLEEATSRLDDITEKLNKLYEEKK